MDEGPMRLIYVGLVIPRKGLLPLIEALAQVRAQNWRLDVVGSLKMDRRYANRCRKLSAHLGLAPRIRFRGEIADTDLMEMMAEAHLLCMPFAYEGFGITTAEAMRCGVPVMGSTSRCHPGVDRPWRKRASFRPRRHTGGRGGAVTTGRRSRAVARHGAVRI
jgi:glycosyltransferase involved in cell wall biosynthesis